MRKPFLLAPIPLTVGDGSCFYINFPLKEKMPIGEHVFKEELNLFRKEPTTAIHNESVASP